MTHLVVHENQRQPIENSWNSQFYDIFNKNGGSRYPRHVNILKMRVKLICWFYKSSNCNIGLSFFKTSDLRAENNQHYYFHYGAPKSVANVKKSDYKRIYGIYLYSTWKDRCHFDNQMCHNTVNFLRIFHILYLYLKKLKKNRLLYY